MGQFTVDINKFAEKAEINAITATRLITLHVFNSVVKRTPVATGRAKGSWTVGVYTMPLDYRENDDKSGSGTMSAIAIAVNGWNGTGSIFIVSNVDYIEYLEDGSSQQSPAGMVAITIAEFQKAVNTAVRSVK